MALLVQFICFLISIFVISQLIYKQQYSNERIFNSTRIRYNRNRKINIDNVFNRESKTNFEFKIFSLEYNSYTFILAQKKKIFFLIILRVFFAKQGVHYIDAPKHYKQRNINYKSTYDTFIRNIYHTASNEYKNCPIFIS